MAGYEYFQLEQQITNLQNEVNNLKFKIAVLEKAGFLKREPLELDDEIKQIIAE